MSFDVIITISVLSAFLIAFLLARIWFSQKLVNLNQQSNANEQVHQSVLQQNTFFQQQLLQLQNELGHSKDELRQLHMQLSEATEETNQHKLRNARLEQQCQQVQVIEDDNDELRNQNEELLREVHALKEALGAEKLNRHHENNRFEEKLSTLKNAEEQLHNRFENLANQIFKTHSSEFAKSSQENLQVLLNPLKSQIEGFRNQVSQQYNQEGQERASLKTEIVNLQQLNKKITEEAAALTRALKGDNKQQGNWGEMVLETILQESGLRSGHEYHTQVSSRTDEGKLYQPDVVVHLPQGKDVIVDSKVSLNAYEKYFNAEADSPQNAHLKEHVLSIRTHIKDLGRKNYHELPGVRSLEYVLMFIPIEGAFLLALEESPDLVKLALDNNILLVSPTNLLVALRTIHNIWQYEYQNENAREIAKKAADLYDKFHGLVSDMEKLGDALNTVHKRYTDASGKLYEGRGNLVRKAEEFQQLGVQPGKKLDADIIKKADG